MQVTMEKQAIIRRFDTTFGKTMIAELTAVAQDPSIPVEGLLALCYDQSRPQIAFRSAWVLEHIAVHDEGRFLPLLPRFLADLPHQRNHSCQRHFTKILMWVTDAKTVNSYQEFMITADKDQLVEVVFGWLIDTETPVAVQVNCLDILFHLCHHADWIAEELETQTRHLLQNGSAAMQSRGKRVLKKLKRVRTAG